MVSLAGCGCVEQPDVIRETRRRRNSRMAINSTTVGQQMISPPVLAELFKFRLDQKAEMQAGRGRPGFDVTRGVVLTTAVMVTGIPLLREGGVDAT